MEPKTSVVTFTPNLIHRSPTSDREDPSRPRLRHLIHRLLPCWKEPRATPALLTSSHFNYYCYSWCIPTLPIIPTCPHSIISLSLFLLTSALLFFTTVPTKGTASAPTCQSTQATPQPQIPTSDLPHNTAAMAAMSSKRLQKELVKVYTSTIRSTPTTLYRTNHPTSHRSKASSHPA
jgi:hypothetical protein